MLNCDIIIAEFYDEIKGKKHIERYKKVNIHINKHIKKSHFSAGNNSDHYIQTQTLK